MGELNKDIIDRLIEESMNDVSPIKWGKTVGWKNRKARCYFCGKEIEKVNSKCPSCHKNQPTGGIAKYSSLDV